ncbi:hypothetical protein pb186bvf_001854 [Paramecium bursaria]
MGNDGGSIPGKAELVRPKKKEVRVESELVAKFRARYCALTKERLRKPIAACRLGYLYNYENVLQQIVDKNIPAEFKHISKLKYIKKLNILENPDQSDDLPFLCPISGQQLNGKSKFLALWSCGCVFSEKGMKDMKIKQKTCPVCEKKYEIGDIVELCPTNEEAELRRAELFKKLESEVQAEPQIKKKVCKEESKKPIVVSNKLQQIQGEAKKTDCNLQTFNLVYNSLFHDKTVLEDNLFVRNVRYGIR